MRVMAAAHLLRYRTTEAKAVLEEAAKGKGLVPFEAGQAFETLGRRNLGTRSGVARIAWTDGPWPCSCPRRSRVPGACGHHRREAHGRDRPQCSQGRLSPAVPTLVPTPDWNAGRTPLECVGTGRAAHRPLAFGVRQDGRGPPGQRVKFWRFRSWLTAPKSSTACPSSRCWGATQTHIKVDANLTKTRKQVK